MLDCDLWPWNILPSDTAGTGCISPVIAGLQFRDCYILIQFTKVRTQFEDFQYKNKFVIIFSVQFKPLVSAFQQCTLGHTRNSGYWASSLHTSIESFSRNVSAFALKSPIKGNIFPPKNYQIIQPPWDHRWNNNIEEQFFCIYLA